MDNKPRLDLSIDYGANEKDCSAAIIALHYNDILYTIFQTNNEDIIKALAEIGRVESLKSQALKILVEKKVDTRILRNCLKDETPEHYNFLNDKHQLTQEEFDSIKEVFIHYDY